MREINVTVTAEIDPRDIRIGCSTASDYCTVDLKCDKCPFDQGSRSLDEILYMYTVMIAKEASHE